MSKNTVSSSGSFRGRGESFKRSSANFLQVSLALTAPTLRHTHISDSLITTACSQYAQMHSISSRLAFINSTAFVLFLHFTPKCLFCQPQMIAKIVNIAQFMIFPAKYGIIDSSPLDTLFTCMATEHPVNPNEKAVIGNEYIPL